MFLPDVNLWLALTFDLHFHHTAAKEWFNNYPAESLFFCRFTQQGFLRLASNPKALKDEAVSLRDGWRLYDMILSDPRVRFLDEPQNVETYWRSYTDLPIFSAKLSGDAYLAALARAAGLQLVTFDQAFRQFKDLIFTILT
jgi:hypothetical protein